MSFAPDEIPVPVAFANSLGVSGRFKGLVHCGYRRAFRHAANIRDPGRHASEIEVDGLRTVNSGSVNHCHASGLNPPAGPAMCGPSKPEQHSMAKKRQLYKVQRRIALAAKLESGVRVGQVWQTIATGKRLATAETIALRARINHDDAVRVVPEITK